MLHLSCGYYKCSHGLKLQACVPEEGSPAIAQPPYRSASYSLGLYEAMSDSRYISSYSSTTGSDCDRSAIGTGGGALYTGAALAVQLLML